MRVSWRRLPSEAAALGNSQGDQDAGDGDGDWASLSKLSFMLDDEEWKKDCAMFDAPKICSRRVAGSDASGSELEAQFKGSKVQN